MAHVEVSKLDKAQHAELCCTYAALLLSDAGVAVDAGKLDKAIAASGNKIDAHWTTLFAKALRGQKIEKFITSGSAGGAAAGGAGNKII